MECPRPQDWKALFWNPCCQKSCWRNEIFWNLNETFATSSLEIDPSLAIPKRESGWIGGCVFQECQMGRMQCHSIANNVTGYGFHPWPSGVVPCPCFARRKLQVLQQHLGQESGNVHAIFFWTRVMKCSSSFIWDIFMRVLIFLVPVTDTPLPLATSLKSFDWGIPSCHNREKGYVSKWTS